MANKVTLRIAGQEYTMMAEENEAYMHEVAELVHQTVLECGGSEQFASTRALALTCVNLADEYMKAKRETEQANQKFEQAEKEMNALRSQLGRLRGGETQTQPHPKKK